MTWPPGDAAVSPASLRQARVSSRFRDTAPAVGTHAANSPVRDLRHVPTAAPTRSYISY
jgi:hypothetical protein